MKKPIHFDNDPSWLFRVTEVPDTKARCMWEGSVIESCVCSGTPSVIAEDQHIRRCDHPSPSHDKDKCIRIPLVGINDAVESCMSCRDWEVRYSRLATTPVGKRHLLYHLLPVSNGVWRKGIDQLRLRWSLFNGRKIVAIMSGGTIGERIDVHEGDMGSPRLLPLDDANVVKNYLPSDCEVLILPNDPHRWELTSWESMWTTLLSTSTLSPKVSDGDAVLYAHAKGVTRRPGSPCHRWADMLYILSLDHWDIVESEFKKFPVVGSLVKRGPCFAPPNDASQWHYSGNFWWSRVGDIRDRLRDNPLPVHEWSTEAWVGVAYKTEECGEIFTPQGPIHLYNPRNLDDVVEQYGEWLRTHLPCPIERR